MSKSQFTARMKTTGADAIHEQFRYLQSALRSQALRPRHLCQAYFHLGAFACLTKAEGDSALTLFRSALTTGPVARIEAEYYLAVGEAGMSTVGFFSGWLTGLHAKMAIAKLKA